MSTGSSPTVIDASQPDDSAQDRQEKRRRTDSERIGVIEGILLARSLDTLARSTKPSRRMGAVVGGSSSPNTAQWMKWGTDALSPKPHARACLLAGASSSTRLVSYLIV